MTRITKDLRDAIVKNALDKAGVKKQLEEYEAKYSKWKEAVRIESLGGPAEAARLEKLVAKIKRDAEGIPAHIRNLGPVIDTNHCIRVRLAGASVSAYFYDEAGSCISVPSSYNVVISSADSPLVQQFYDLENEKRAISERGDAIEAQVRATVEKFGTVKRLLGGWPEASELLPATTPEAKAKLPAVPVADLNALVGLPSDKGEA